MESKTNNQLPIRNLNLVNYINKKWLLLISDGLLHLHYGSTCQYQREYCGKVSTS